MEPDDPYERASKRFKSLHDMLNPKLKEKFKALEHITAGDLRRKKTNNTWNDSKITAMEHLDVASWTRLSEEEKRRCLTSALNAMTKSVSASSVGAVLICAWGLVSCKDRATLVFPETTGMSVAAKSVESLTRDVLYSNEANPCVVLPQTTEPRWGLAKRSGCYLCCSLLRLVAKEEGNVLNAWRAICGRYRDFYNEELGIQLEPSRDALRAVRILLQNPRVMKGTVGAFLVNGKNLDRKDRALCEMLYERPLKYTGMHPYSLTVCCADKLEVPVRVLMELLEHSASTEALLMIEHVLAEYESPECPDRVKLVRDTAYCWRYARIFDPDVFSTLQAKDCLMLTGALAVLADKIGAGGRGNATGIKQLSGILKAQRGYLETVATNIIEEISSRKASGLVD